jgi:hypothetical protein
VVRCALLLAVEAGGLGALGGSTEGSRGAVLTSFATALTLGAGGSACELLAEDCADELFGASGRLILPTSSK